MARRILCVVFLAGMAAVYCLTGTTAALLLLYAGAALPLLGILAAWLAARQLQVRIELPEGIQKGVPAQGRLELRGPVPLPIVCGVLELELRNGLTREVQRLPLTFSLGGLGRKSVPFSFQIACCGPFSFSCGEVTVRDAMGLVTLRHSAARRETRLILPELFPVRVQLTGSEAFLGGEDSVNFNRKGQDWSDPFQIRDYVQGDHLKQIHWKLSRKLDRYLVTDPAQALERALLVFWDRSALAQDAPARIPDTLAEAVISFCMAAAQEEIPYSIAWSRPGDGTCEVRDVGCTEELYDIVPAMLGVPEGETGISGIPECIQALGGRHYPLIAYFSDHVPAGIAELETIGRAALFLCGEEVGDTGDLPSVLFSPFDYRQVLSTIAI